MLSKQKKEEKLVTFLSCAAQIHLGRTDKEVIAIVERILSSRGNVRTVIPGCWTSFTKIHPNLAFSTPATFLPARASASNCEILDNLMSSNPPWKWVKFWTSHDIEHKRDRLDPVTQFLCKCPIFLTHSCVALSVRIFVLSISTWLLAPGFTRTRLKSRG